MTLDQVKLFIRSSEYHKSVELVAEANTVRVGVNASAEEFQTFVRTLELS